MELNRFLCNQTECVIHPGRKKHPKQRGTHACYSGVLLKRMFVSPSNLFRGNGNKNGRSLRMRILDPTNGPEWDRVIASHPEGDCFHSSGWAKVLHQTYKH